MAIQKLKPLKHFCMTIGELPSSYVETMSYYEMILWFVNYIKTQVIPVINNNAEILEDLKKIVDDIDVNFDELQREIDELDESIHQELLTLKAQLEYTIILNVNTLNGRIDNEVATLNDRIDDIALDDVNVLNPTNGLVENVQKVIDDIWNGQRTYALTCLEYDLLELTAEEYDNYELTAYEFDTNGKILLENN